MDEAKLYEQVNLMAHLDFIQFMDSQRARLKNVSNQRVLDVGCGPGDLTVKIAKAYFPPGTSVTGCDCSEKMIEYASRTHGCPDVEFKILNIEGQDIFTSWDKESFDVIVSNYSFQWVKNQRLGAGNIFSLLKDGGDVFMCVLVKHPFITTLGSVSKRNDFSIYTKGFHHFKGYPNDMNNVQSEFTELFKSSGFTQVKVTPLKKNYYWPTFDAALNALRCVDPYRSSIPDNMIDLYTNVIRESLMLEDTITIEENGWVRIDYEVCWIYAKK